MAGEGAFSGRNAVSDLTLKCFIFVLFYNFQFVYSYPFFGGKRYLRTVPIRRSYISIPLSQLHNEYQMPDYEDAYIPSTQSDYDFNPYEKYPYVQYLGYYPSRSYYHDKSPRRNLDGYGYFDDQLPQDDISDEMNRQEKGDVYPYGQETWYEEDTPKFDRNSEANKAFLQNLIIAQMYQDAKNQNPYGYDPNPSDDYEDQQWFYGVPTTEEDDREKVKQYFKNKEDEEVMELESLARKKGKNKKQKEKENYKKQKAMGVMDKPAKSKSKMTDDEYFDMQKQLIVNSRKKGYGPITVPGSDGFRFSKKQVYDSADSSGDFWSFNKPYQLNSDFPVNAVKKINLNNDVEEVSSFSDSNVNVESTPTATTTTTTTTTAPLKRIVPTKRPVAVGQKEVVLPRPSNPVRRLFGDVSSRSLHQPSVYDTIKKLLNMEKDLQKEEMTQPQKRFVLNEDQLTAELSGLKKKSA